MKQHKRRHRAVSRLKKFKYLAAAVAGTAILSGASMPALPASTANAAADPGGANSPSAATQQVVNHDAAAPQHQKGPKAPTNFKQVLNIKATAYAPGAHDNDQWGSKTFLGTTIRPGVIAVDPSVIPLGSRVYIQYPDGHGEYAVAEDTGGAIKGNRIDIAKTTVGKAQDFGIQHVKVYVMHEHPNA
jgi:3D (Asp-Asp-Asp) domain-containing protein